MNYAKLVERHIETQRRPDGRHAARSAWPGGGRAVRRDGGRRREPRRRLRGEAAAARSRFPAIREHALGLDGHLRLHRPLPLRAALPRRHPARQPSRLRPRHHPLGDRHAPRVRLSVHGREPQEGRLLARRGHAGRLLRGQHGPDLGRSAVEHVRRATGRSAPTSRTCRRRSSCSPRRARRPAAARPSTASSARAAIVSGGQVERSILGPNVAHQQLRRRWKIRSSSRA